jgi:hypothetical protein
MRIGKRRSITAAVLLVGAVLAAPAIVAAKPDSSATARFGNLKAGSPFPPGEHDSSFNGEDNIIPRTVNVSAGGTVTFPVDGFHWPVIYKQGITPDDIVVPAFPPESNIFMNDFDPAKLLAAAPGPESWTSPPLTTPGRYLMLCNVTPHFAFAKMYGWIHVK